MSEAKPVQQTGLRTISVQVGGKTVIGQVRPDLAATIVSVAHCEGFELIGVGPVYEGVHTTRWVGPIGVAGRGAPEFRSVLMGAFQDFDVLVGSDLLSDSSN